MWCEAARPYRHRVLRSDVCVWSFKSLEFRSWWTITWKIINSQIRSPQQRCTLLAWPVPSAAIRFMTWRLKTTSHWVPCINGYTFTWLRGVYLVLQMQLETQSLSVTGFKSGNNGDLQTYFYMHSNKSNGFRQAKRHEGKTRTLWEHTMERSETPHLTTSSVDKPDHTIRRCTRLEEFNHANLISKPRDLLIRQTLSVNEARVVWYNYTSEMIQLMIFSKDSTLRLWHISVWFVLR